jgi:hypothetical protein
MFFRDIIDTIHFVAEKLIASMVRLILAPIIVQDWLHETWPPGSGDVLELLRVVRKRKANVA